MAVTVYELNSIRIGVRVHIADLKSLLLVHTDRTHGTPASFEKNLICEWRAFH